MSNSQWHQDQCVGERAARENERQERLVRQAAAELHGQTGGILCPAVPVGIGVAQSIRSPGKMFSRSDILAILKGHLALAYARPPEMNERDAIRALITTFENLE